MADKQVFGNSGPIGTDIKHSTFDKSFTNNLTCRFGRMYPVFVEEAPANSHYKINPTFAFDFQSLLWPIQNNVTAHLSFFKVPFRILWKNYRRFAMQIGSDGHINGTNSFSMPFISRSEHWTAQGSLADYMGIPSNFISERSFSNLQEIRLSSIKLAQFQEVSPSTGEHGVYDINYYTPSPSDSNFFYSFAFDVRRGAEIDTDKVVEFDFYTSENTFSGFTNSPYIMAYANLGSRYGSSIRNAPTYLFKASSVAFTSTQMAYGASTFYKIHVTLSLSLTTAETELLNEGLAANGLTFRVLFSYVDASSYLVSRPTGFPSDSVPLALITTPDKEDSDTLTTSSTLRNFGISSICYYNTIEKSNGGASHFRTVDGEPPLMPINALPFRAYEFIYRYYFQNTRIVPFYKNGQPCYDEYLTNDGDGADSTTPVDFFNCNYEYDLFTTAVKEPFFGNAPLVGVTSNSSDAATFHMVDGNNNSYTFTVNTDSAGHITGISEVDSEHAGSTPVEFLRYASQYGISISDFRNANALTRFQEKYMRAGTKYENILKEFFNVTPSLGEEYPVYLGGVSRKINISKVTNVAQSEGNPLGDFAGTANVFADGKEIKCFCSEPCYIMGILYFSVTPVYTQQLPKHFLKSKLEDYLNPLFANISPQPIYCKQLAPLQLDAEHADDVFGYGRPYSEYVSRQDEVHGDFRGNMSNFLLQRLFFDKPQLNRSFIEVRAEDLTDVFTFQQNTDKIFGQVAFGVQASLPLPRFSVPQLGD